MEVKSQKTNSLSYAILSLSLLLSFWTITLFEFVVKLTSGIVIPNLLTSFFFIG
jgi:hypothetical protein